MKGFLIKTKNYILVWFRLILYSIVAALIAAATMAVLNILVEVVKKDSIFSLKDIFSLSLWHMAIGIWFGAFLGIVTAFYFTLIKKNAPKNILIFLIYIYFLLALLVAVIGYINQYFLASIFTLKSMTLNFAFMVAGLILLFVFIKKVKVTKVKKFPTLLRVYVLILVLILSYSLVLNSGLLKKSSRIDDQIIAKIEDPLNVMIISLDAVRFDHLSCYEYERKTTPNIDRLASKGALFLNAFSQSSHTKESVPSLLTSTYPSTHNVKSLSSALPKNLLTLPSVFQSFGFKTALFSANSVVSPAYGYQRGVDDFFGPQTDKIRATILGNLLYRMKGLKIPVLSSTTDYLLGWSYSLVGNKKSLYFDDAHEVTQKAMTWISENQDEPFFMYFHYAGGHAPYTPPAPYHKLFDPHYSDKPVTNYPQNLEMFLPFEKGRPLPERELKNMIAQYDGEIFDHDKNLGLLFDHLKKLHLEEKTIIIITADHGEEFYEHQGWGHGHSLFDEVIHVPLIIYAPKMMTEAKKVKDLAAQVDIFPTLCRLCGISPFLKLSYDIEGMDLSPTFISTEKKYVRRFVFSEVYHGGNSAKCLRSQEYKAIKVNWNDKTKRLLFHLTTDPLEKNNIANKDKDILEDLFGKIDTIVEQSKKKSFEPKPIVMDEDLKEQLRSLGYIK